MLVGEDNVQKFWAGKVWLQGPQWHQEIYSYRLWYQI